MKENKAAKYRPNMLLTLLLAAFMTISLGVFINSIMEYNEIGKEIEVAERNIEACEAEIGALEHEYAAPIDDKYIESVAKDKLGLVFPDEIIVYNDVNQ